MVSFSQPTATSAPLGATLFTQYILYTIKLQPTLAYKREMDYKVIEAWIYNVNNYIALNGMTDPSQ